MPADFPQSNLGAVSRQENHIRPKERTGRVETIRTGHYQVFGSLHIQGFIGGKQAVTNWCHQPCIPLVISFHRGRSGIVSRIFTRRLAGWFSKLPVHLVMLVVGLILCQKLILPSRWCQLSGSPTDVRERSGIQGSKDIVLRQSIEVYVPERSRGAEQFLSRYQPIHTRYSIQSRHRGTLTTAHLPCILPTCQRVHVQFRRHVCLILSPTAGIWTVPKKHTV